MKVKPVLWKYHKTKDRKYPVKIRITSTQDKKTKVKYISLDFSVDTSQWTGSRVKAHPNAQDYNLKIINTLSEIERNFSSFGHAEAGNKKDFYHYCTKYQQYLDQTAGLYHRKKITTVVSRLRTFRPSLPLSSLTGEFVSEYEGYLLKEGLHRNYVSDQLERIRTIVKLAVKDGALEYHKNPFLGYKLRSIKSVKKRLTLDQVKTLQKAILKGPECLARDMYVFSFYCGGMRFGDICRITKSNFSDRFQYTMHKGIKGSDPSLINIGLHPVAKKIAKKYNFQFPVGVDWAREEQTINSRNCYFNKVLKAVCDKEGIPEITYHTARHSIADLSVKMKLSSSEMKGVLGHKKLATTEIYLKEFYQEQTDEAMNKLFEKKPSRGL